MKHKLAILLSGLVLPLAMSGVAHADTTTITNTGPGSTNISTVTNTFIQTETNTNSVFVSTSNVQTGTSGNANVNDNTTGGDAISGNVNNSFNTSTAVSINNGGPAVGGSGAGVTENPSAITGAGGEGAGSVATLGQSVTTLPKTGGGSLSDLMKALMNARTGVIGQRPASTTNWSWVPSILAFASAIGATYVYSKYKAGTLYVKF